MPDITSKNSNNKLLVSIFPQKNPIARGDSQNIIITVTDSNSKVVPDVHLNGKLIYPGGSYEKDFSGSTDADGKFEYSLTIGKNGDVGPLSIEVDASNPAYESGSVTDSFLLVDSSGLSATSNISPTSEIKQGISFAAAGDFYCDVRTKKTTKAMQEKNPDLVLALGDLSEVKNPDQEIREAVLDIISQSGNRDFIPDLLEAAAQTNDPDLKKAIAEVVEFLKLPTLTEVLRQTNR